MGEYRIAHYRPIFKIEIIHILMKTSQFSTSPPNPHRLSVAPMMDWTDRHCRVFHRMLAPQFMLYSEMVTSDAIIHGDAHRLLDGYHVQLPQLGGGDPVALNYRFMIK